MNLNHLLSQYFLLRRSMTVSSPLGSDPTASRVPSSDFSGSIGLMCDVGMCLEQLSAGHRAAIIERWGLWLEREDVDALMCRWSDKALSAMRANRRGAEKRARKIERGHRNEARRLTSELFKADKAPTYVKAINALRVEVRARDLYARGVCGDSGGISGVR